MKKNLIPISAIITFGTISMANLETRGGLPTSDQWLGLVAAFTIISIGVDLGLPISGGMAVLLMVSVLLSRGPEAFKFLVGSIRDQEKRNKSKKKRKAPTNPKREPRELRGESLA